MRDNKAKSKIKLPLTEKYIKDGIKMSKLVNRGFWNNTYDHKTVYDLDEAVNLSNNGWYFSDYDDFFSNLVLFLWRDLKINNMEK